MTIDTQQMAAIVDEGKQHWAGRQATVRQLVRLLGIDQSDIAAGLGISRQSLNGRITGKIQWNPWELDAMAIALNVDREVLDMNPSDAMRWVLDHSERYPDIRWSSLSPLRAA
jgi:transcriptional regulator with XRE-family HTH domain